MKGRYIFIVLGFLLVFGGLGWILATSDHTADYNIPGKTTTSGRNSLASPGIER